MADNATTAPSEPDITDPPQPPKKKRAVMRTPGATIIAIFLLTIGMTPVASSAPGMLVLYLIPAALLYWVLRVRTIVTPDGLFVRKPISSTHIDWSAVTGFAADNRGRLAAVTTDGTTTTRTSLPAVRGRHLPVLSLLSGGRLPDPTGLTGTAATASPEQDQHHDAGSSGKDET